MKPESAENFSLCRIFPGDFFLQKKFVFFVGAGSRIYAGKIFAEGSVNVTVAKNHKKIPDESGKKLFC
jgi:hypothetical protein